MCRLLLISLYFAPHLAYALDASAVFKKASLSSVVVKTSGSQGSGIVYHIDNTELTPQTHILTNCHVVKGARYATISRLGKSTQGEVILCDAERDVAIVKVAGELPKPQLRVTPLEVGERVFAIGSPRGLELSISEGIISQLRPSPLGAEPLIQTTAPISPGSSGGGLFDSQARLIGITTLTLTDSQGLNFAIPYSFAVDAAVIAQNTNQSTAPAPTAPACGWQRISESDIYIAYIDYCTRSPYGSFQTVWTMFDFKVRQSSYSNGKWFYSSKNKVIVDCTRRAKALASINGYESHMGSGSIVYSYSIREQDWNFIDAIPGSMNEVTVNAVCGAR